ncbi:MAG: hypothetical protein ACRDYE_01280 [Acidimicrobiales bacterium]
MRRTRASMATSVPSDASPLIRRRSVGLMVVITTLCVSTTLTGCSLHTSDNGVSGKILGHPFSASKGSLPAGFPGDVPTPDSSRVLGGAGAGSRWDAAFAVTGSITVGTMTYASKLRSAGYAITDYQSGATPVTGATGSGSTATTVTLSGTTFEATNPLWAIRVAAGSTSSVTGTGLRAGEFAINLTVLPTSSSTTTTT